MKFLFPFIAFAVSGLLVGCSTMDSGYRSMTRMTNPDKMNLKSDVRWANQQPYLRDVTPDARVVYVRLRNSSASPVELTDLLTELNGNLQVAGYRVTDNVDEANFVLNADIRYFGENAEKELGAGAVASTVIGGVTGAVIGGSVREGRGTTLGAIGGAAAGAGLANVMANRNKLVHLNFIVDTRIGERVKGGVETQRTSTADSEVHHQDRSGIAGMAEGASSKGGTTERQVVSVEDQFLYHQNRWIAHAQKVGLTHDEALPVLLKKLSASLASVLP